MKRGGVISLVFIGGILVDEGGSLESTLVGLDEESLLLFAEAEVSFHWMQSAC